MKSFTLNSEQTVALNNWCAVSQALCEAYIGEESNLMAEFNTYPNQNIPEVLYDMELLLCMNNLHSAAENEQGELDFPAFGMHLLGHRITNALINFYVWEQKKKGKTPKFDPVMKSEDAELLLEHYYEVLLEDGKNIDALKGAQEAVEMLRKGYAVWKSFGSKKPV